MSKVFIDVGGYKGHSVLAALDPLFGFSRIFCFEPATTCIGQIARIRDPRLVIVKAGLSNRTGKSLLYNPGTLAASLFADAPIYGGETGSEAVDVIAAGEFFRTFLRADDQVFMKLNCEGSELDVLESILDEQVSTIISNVLIDLDALKIPSQCDRAGGVMKRVVDAQISYFTPDQVQYGMVTNYGGVRNWLIEAGASSPGISRRLRSLAYNARIAFTEPECSGYHKKKVLDAMPWLARFARSRRH
jgi:FkbM family methyltransferase